MKNYVLVIMNCHRASCANNGSCYVTGYCKYDGMNLLTTVKKVPHIHTGNNTPPPISVGMLENSFAIYGNEYFLGKVLEFANLITST